MMIPRKKRTLTDRLWRRVDKTPQCWVWTGMLHVHSKHGMIGDGNGGMKYVHRVAYEMEVGPIPDGMCVCHRCDNPPCRNPAHLFPGTQADNMRDMNQKNRHAHGYGRLSESDAREIKALLAAGKESQRAIGERFGVTQGAVYGIKIGRAWRHIDANGAST